MCFVVGRQLQVCLLFRILQAGADAGFLLTRKIWLEGSDEFGFTDAKISVTMPVKGNALFTHTMQ